MSEEKEEVEETKKGFTNEQSFWLCIVFMICVTVIVILGSVCSYYTSVAEKAIENGYEQGTVKGEQGTYWIKKCEPTKPKE